VSRQILIRGGDGDRLVAESALPLESNLHDALAMHPGLIPTADLGLGETVVAGRESSLGGGFADLVLLGRSGQLGLVEVKKEGNPDTRQVVAQLLDYAAGLWGQTPDAFMDKVVRPHLARNALDASVSLTDFLRASFDGAEAPVSDQETELALRTLEAGLQEGAFTLIVAAPQIPAGVERALDYLNARGMRMYGLEVGYFHGDVDCFVPRLTVKPAPTKRLRSAAEPLTRNAFLDSLDHSIAAGVATALDDIEGAGGRVEWNSLGASIKADLATTRQLAAFEGKTIFVAVRAPSGYPPAPFEETRTALANIGKGRTSKDGTHHLIAYTELNTAQLQEVTAVITQLARQLTR
jgi:hypothetical protein